MRVFLLVIKRCSVSKFFCRVETKFQAVKRVMNHHNACCVVRFVIPKHVDSAGWMC